MVTTDEEDKLKMAFLWKRKYSMFLCNRKREQIIAL